jgi:hypothetical protein
VFWGDDGDARKWELRAPADQSALDLGVPTLDDIDPALLDVMRCAAENGLIGCEPQQGPEPLHPEGPAVIKRRCFDCP